MAPQLRRFFEYQWIEAGPAGDELPQLELDAIIEFNDANDGQYFEVGHKRIRAKNFVGYLEVGGFAIEILPKADRHSPEGADVWRNGLIEMLRVALGMKLMDHGTASQHVTRTRFLDLIAQAFMGELEPLLHHGLAKGYRTVQSNGPVFRGKLKLADHVRENNARADRFFVEYQTFDHDILVNQLLAAALHELSWGALSAGVASRVEEIIARFPEVRIAGVTSALFDRVVTTRATRRYDAALMYARMILAQQGPQLRSGRKRVFALLFDMNKLWEKYIAVLMGRVAPPGVEVEKQCVETFWTSKSPKAVKASVRPDIVLRRDGKAILVIDTKWKASGGGPADADLKQMFVYNELLGCRRSILLYPKLATSQPSSGLFAKRDHDCAQAYVGLFAGEKWDSEEIGKQLRALASAAIGST